MAPFHRRTPSGTALCEAEQQDVAFNRWAPVLCASAAVLASCTAPGPSNPPLRGFAQKPDVRQVSMWRMLGAIGALQGIVRAPSGDYWAAGGDVAALSRFTPGGKLTTYQLAYVPSEIAADRSGNLWFTNARFPETILRFDPATLALAAFSLTDEAYGGITLGYDGNIWFVEQTHIGKLTPGGALTEYPTPLIQGASGLSWSAGGRVWFGASGPLGYQLASLNALSGSVKLYNTRVTSSAGAIVAGPNGTVWYVITGRPDQLVRFDPRNKSIATYRAPRNFTASPCSGAMASSPDGSIWYATQRLRGQRFGKHVVGGGYIRFDIKSKRFTAYPSPKGYDWNCDLVVGSRGAVWSTAGPGVSVLYQR
jgi:streptogramin lyase